MVAIGCVIRGETYHFELVANESSRGITDMIGAEAISIANCIPDLLKTKSRQKQEL